jgi:hypothetical protein
VNVAHYDPEKTPTIINLRTSEAETLDVICHDPSFFPARSPQKTLLVVRDSNLSDSPGPAFWLWPLDRYIPNLPPFHSCLRISPYPPDILFGYISSDALLIYELVIEEEIPSGCSIRRFATNGFTFRSFDFSESAEIAAICESRNGDADFELWWYRLTRSDSIGLRKFKGPFIEAAVSPVESGRIAVLTQYGIELRVRHGGGQDDSLSPRMDIECGPKRICGSSFGSALRVLCRDRVREFIEVAPNRWLSQGE